MPKSALHIDQFKINAICSCLLFSGIRTTADLNQNFYTLMAKIKSNPEIFKATDSIEQCYLMLQEAIKSYNSVNDYSIKFTEDFALLLQQVILPGSSQQVTAVQSNDDLSRVTKGYDRLVRAKEKKLSINEQILAILKNKEFTVCPEVIIGAGDTGTTVWLEKYKAKHGTVQKSLAKKQLPDVLMIAEDEGSWKHDYTLAQPLSILERTNTRNHLVDYMSKEYYQQNPYANGRHIYQVNQATLAQTNAPLLQATVLRVETKNNHAVDFWMVSGANYRLILKTALGLKVIYTDTINFCTGLGPARDSLAPTVIERSLLKKLNQFDAAKQFTPMVDGNQFMLTGSEENSTKPRTIVVYGGGGTAAACYRKGFFGHDSRTENLPFNKAHQKNNVLWVAKQFEKAGTGKLVTTVLQTAKQRKELEFGDLVKVNRLTNGKLLLTFKVGTEILKIEADQLIYSIGQDNSRLKQLSREVEADLALNFDSKGMVLNVVSPDRKVIFFGAAAMAVREKEYTEATWRWLREQNIGGDVGPGSMPPSRAQMKRFNTLNGIPPETINVNMDSSYLITEYLEKTGVKHVQALAFVDALLTARKNSTAGCNYATLKSLLKSHSLDGILDIKGHGHLVRKQTSSGFSLETIASFKHSQLHGFFNKKPVIAVRDDFNAVVEELGDAEDVNVNLPLVRPPAAAVNQNDALAAPVMVPAF